MLIISFYFYYFLHIPIGFFHIPFFFSFFFFFFLLQIELCCTMNSDIPASITAATGTSPSTRHSLHSATRFPPPPAVPRSTAPSHTQFAYTGASFFANDSRVFWFADLAFEGDARNTKLPDLSRSKRIVCGYTVWYHTHVRVFHTTVPCCPLCETSSGPCKKRGEKGREEGEGRERSRE
jgi:hypothetical protein